MPALNFHPQFAEAVRVGAKRQTVRRVWADGRFPFDVGSILHLWVRQRHPRRRKLGVAVCTGTTHVRIADGRVTLGYRPLAGEDLERFARADGFETADDFVAFFGGRDLDGFVIYWGEVRAP